MDLTLHYRIYGEGVDQIIISKYTEYIKSQYLYYLTKNYVWRA